MLALAGLLALGCAGAPSPGPAEPAAPESGPATVDPRFAAAAAYSANHAGHAFLVLEGERIVHEEGQNGHAAAAAHPLNEGSQAFWGVLAAAADQDGLLDLDEPVVFTLPEFEADPRKREMRVRQLLNFTSGLEGGLVALAPEVPDRTRRALALASLAEPGQRFQYGPSHLFVFAEILRRKLVAAHRGDDPLRYLEQRLLDPIDAPIAAWERDAQGQPSPSDGASLTPRAWARFGRLLRDDGRWQGDALVDADVLAACFQGSRVNPRFGLSVWLNPPPPPRGDATGWTVRDPTRSFFPEGLRDLRVASGHDNQRLYVIPSLDLVVVRFGAGDRSFRDEELLTHIVAGAATAPAQPPAAQASP